MRLKLIHTLLMMACACGTIAQEPDSVLQKRYNDLGNSYLIKADQNKKYLDSAFYFLRKSVYLIDSSNRQNLPVTNGALELLATAFFQAGDTVQGKKILKQVISSYRQAGNKKREADTWYRQSKLLSRFCSSPDLLDSSFRQASSLYAELGRVNQKISADYDLAYWHFARGRQALAEMEFEELLKLTKSQADPRLLQYLLFAAQVKRYSGSFQQGLSYALDAEQLMRQNKDSATAHDVYAELALLYEELNEPEKSIYWYDQCIKERVRLNYDKYILYRTAYLMVIQRIKTGKEQEAFSILLSLKKTNPPQTIIDNAVLSQSLAYCYNAMEQYQNAEKHFMAMIPVMNTHENGEQRFVANFDVGQFYITHHLYAKAEPYIQTAFKDIDGPGVSRIKDLYLLQFKIDSAAGRLLPAINNYQKYKWLNDSLFNETKSKQIEELSIKYDVEKKEQNLTLLQKENNVQQKGLEQAKLTRNLILAGVSLLLLVMALLYNRYQFKQKLNRKLEASQKEIEKQNNTLQRLVTEKEWLLKEIHHRVKNNLHTIVGLLDTQAAYLKTNEARTAIADSQHRVQAMSIIHQKLFHSDNLSDIEMSGYIHELVGYLEHSFGTEERVQFDMDIDEITMDLSYALPISLILNEAITNSIKYAFPNNKHGSIVIRLKHKSGVNHLLSVSDSGKGMPEGFDFKNSKSMGMSLMAGLSEDIHGSFSIHNNNGTEVIIAFAYEPANREQIRIS